MRCIFVVVASTAKQWGLCVCVCVWGFAVHLECISHERCIIPNEVLGKLVVVIIVSINLLSRVHCFQSIA